MENVLNLENWIICGQAMLKMLEWGWPIPAAFAAFCVWEYFRANLEVKEVK